MMTPNGSYPSAFELAASPTDLLLRRQSRELGLSASWSMLELLLALACFSKSLPGGWNDLLSEYFMRVS